MKIYPAILAALYNAPHVIELGKLHEIEAFLSLRARGVEHVTYDVERRWPEARCVAVDSGENFALDQMQATVAASRHFVAVLPLFGTLFQHGDMAMDASGGTSTEAWSRDLKRLDANASIKTVVIETHSPGGQVMGTEEAANVVREIRKAGRTRIVSVVNSQMASGAIWIGTAAQEVYITPGGKMGSIGVVSMHQDVSKQQEASGVKTTLRAIPAKKILGNELTPLDDEAAAVMDDNNQVVFAKFVAAMARNRGVSTMKVERDFGGGGMLRSDEAVKVGLADGIMTMAEVLDRELGLLKNVGKKSMKNQLAIARAQD
jgi:ClpP class serine protease